MRKIAAATGVLPSSIILDNVHSDEGVHSCGGYADVHVGRLHCHGQTFKVALKVARATTKEVCGNFTYVRVLVESLYT